jgi:hypothetical protein
MSYQAHQSPGGRPVLRNRASGRREVVKIPFLHPPDSRGHAKTTKLLLGLPCHYSETCDKGESTADARL